MITEAIDVTKEFIDNNYQITLNYPSCFIYDPKQEVFKNSLIIEEFNKENGLFLGIIKNIFKSMERNEFQKYGFEYVCNFEVKDTSFFIIEYFDDDKGKEISRYKFLISGFFEVKLKNTSNKDFQIIIRKI